MEKIIENVNKTEYKTALTKLLTIKQKWLDCLESPNCNSIKQIKSINGESLINILNFYKADMDPEEFEDLTFPLTYNIINFILKSSGLKDNALKQITHAVTRSTMKRINKKLSLLKKQRPNSLLELCTPEFLETMVDYGKILYQILLTAPIIKDLSSPIYLFRGFRWDDPYYEIMKKEMQNITITIPFFLSTSIKFDKATNFTSFGKECYWIIKLVNGNPFSFISNSSDIDDCEECEVLLNAGTVLKLIKKEDENIYHFEYEKQTILEEPLNLNRHFITKLRKNQF